MLRTRGAGHGVADMMPVLGTRPMTARAGDPSRAFRVCDHRQSLVLEKGGKRDEGLERQHHGGGSRLHDGPGMDRISQALGAFAQCRRGPGPGDHGCRRRLDHARNSRVHSQVLYRAAWVMTSTTAWPASQLILPCMVTPE